MSLERRLQQDLRESIDWLIGRGYELTRPAGQLTLARGCRRLVVAGGQLIGARR
ncbi:hypothetical protein [Pseudomonas sp. SO81]|uniref:hypothetical protein n=1 Tax=Pseudomonas sp. SO81 TaxID=2983246 RepID=UPI0025A39C28|nr:hypothetical protein [Pseudomonas sp. SO81]WJN61338.1 hypothetical protein OH686_21555 [Pseudomonas sp. SO81]